MQRKKKRVKKAPPLNRQEPWFLGRDYSSTSFTQLHQVNKYNHAVEGLEVLRGYTGRQNELDRRINDQRGSHADLYKRCALPAANGQSMVCASQMDFGQLPTYLPPVNYGNCEQLYLKYRGVRPYHFIYMPPQLQLGPIHHISYAT